MYLTCFRYDEFTFQDSPQKGDNPLHSSHFASPTEFSMIISIKECKMTVAKQQTMQTDSSNKKNKLFFLRSYLTLVLHSAKQKSKNKETAMTVNQHCY